VGLRPPKEHNVNINDIPRQDADGDAHFTYFDKNTQASFVWDGESPVVQVSLGGYGEPVFSRFPIQYAMMERDTPKMVLTWFKVACDIWLVGFEANRN
jgi:hypothetical protein